MTGVLSANERLKWRKVKVGGEGKVDRSDVGVVGGSVRYV
jgi:hypothetical protein